MVRCDSEIPAIKQCVDILPKQQPIGRLVRATIGIGADMRRLQNVEDVRVRDGTLAFVEVGDDYAKCTLAEARKEGLRLTKA